MAILNLPNSWNSRSMLFDDIFFFVVLSSIDDEARRSSSRDAALRVVKNVDDVV